ncbi:MAG: hypothetical protein CMA67_02725 [Euryarchaeota archaeon]|nr:hypothetical protein [Euryarchaeota archaeon]
MLLHSKQILRPKRLEKIPEQDQLFTLNDFSSVQIKLALPRKRHFKREGKNNRWKHQKCTSMNGW